MEEWSPYSRQSNGSLPHVRTLGPSRIPMVSSSRFCVPSRPACSVQWDSPEVSSPRCPSAQKEPAVADGGWDDFNAEVLSSSTVRWPTADEKCSPDLHDAFGDWDDITSGGEDLEPSLLTEACLNGLVFLCGFSPELLHRLVDSSDVWMRNGSTY